MRLLAVPAAALAVVGRGDDQRLRERPVALQAGEQRPDGGVHGRDLAQVRVAARLLQELARRIVGEVRVVEVQPQEEGLVPARVEPGERARDDLLRRTAGAQVLLDVGRRGRRVVVLEALVEPELGREHDGGDEGGAGVALLARALRQRLRRGRETRLAVAAQRVAQRIEAGEQRGVRRQGQRRHGARVLEHDALARQTVEVRRQPLRAAVAAERLRVGRVEREQHERRPLLARAGTQRERQQHGEATNGHVGRDRLLRRGT